MLKTPDKECMQVLYFDFHFNNYCHILSSEL